MTTQSDLTRMSHYADALLRAGEQLAVKLRDTDNSPWTDQILDEWREAKDVLREALDG